MVDDFSLLPALLFITFFFFYYFNQHCSCEKKSSRRPPTKISFFEMVKNKERILEWTTELVLASPTNTITMPYTVVTSNPENIEHILKTNFHNYPKGDDFTAIFSELLGHGILNSDSDRWRLQRKAASHEFSTKNLRSVILDKVRNEFTDRLVPLLSKAAATGASLDLHELLDRLTFDVVCQIVSGVDPASLGYDKDDVGRFIHAYEAVMGVVNQRFDQPCFLWKLQRLLGIGSERRLKENIGDVHEFAMRIVKQRKGRKPEEIRSSNDFLSHFVLNGNSCDEFLRDIIINFVFAGRESTPTAMAWFFWLVSTQPEVEERILDEIDSVRRRHGNPDGNLTLDELREMDYLHAVLSETLRLYPPVALCLRQCAEDDSLPDGTVVKKGWRVIYNSYAMGMMESIWGEDCKEFKPERWLENGVFGPKSPYQFPAFHAGPRTCLGKEMAYILMKVVATSIIERFSFEVSAKEEIKFFSTLKMKGGLPVSVRMKEGKRTSKNGADFVMA
ncbi:cytochrome P450 CYP94D108-like [Elaeis guineensis]|uniref:Cytochrome P450 94B3-like n=1 Tax=Elaeis guineensis var. tenera TaxID=51953 RepID=A0A6I9QXA4_ELAGV|nr:cytochrome P450 94B3-like [Elaeis guineensis]